MDSPRTEGLHLEQSDTASGLTFAIARHARDGATAGQIADAVVAMWQQIDAALSPVIGGGGMAALYARSLDRVESVYPWLHVAVEGDRQTMELAPLRAAIAAQSRRSAAAAGCSTLQTFNALLESMIGPSLCESFLSPLWARPSPDAPKQGSPP